MASCCQQGPVSRLNDPQLSVAASNLLRAAEASRALRSISSFALFDDDAIDSCLGAASACPWPENAVYAAAPLFLTASKWCGYRQSLRKIDGDMSMNCHIWSDG